MIRIRTSRYLLGLWSALVVWGSLGCHSPSQPWAGEAYQAPQGYKNPARSTYTLTPSILPSRRAPEFDQSQEDQAIEKMLFDK